MEFSITFIALVFALFNFPTVIMFVSAMRTDNFVCVIGIVFWHIILQLIRRTRCGRFGILPDCLTTSRLAPHTFALPLAVTAPRV